MIAGFEILALYKRERAGMIQTCWIERWTLLTRLLKECLRSPEQGANKRGLGIYGPKSVETITTRVHHHSLMAWRMIVIVTAQIH